MSKFAPEIQALRDQLSAGVISQTEYEAKAKEFLQRDSFQAPKRPMMTHNPMQIKSPAEQRAAWEAQRNLSGAKKLTAQEIEARELAQKERRRAESKAKRADRKVKGATIQPTPTTVAAVMVPLPTEKEPFRTTFRRLSGDTIIMSAETGMDGIRRAVELLLSGDYHSAKLERGVCLTVYFVDGGVMRRWYADPNAAHSGGLHAGDATEKRPARDVDHFTVDDTIRRGEVLAAMKAPSMDPIIPSRKRPVMEPKKNYDPSRHWGKAKQDRASFSWG